MSQSKIIAAIIVYFPDEKTLAHTIESLYDQVDKLIILDNTPGGSDVFRDGALLAEKEHRTHHAQRKSWHRGARTSA